MKMKAHIDIPCRGCDDQHGKPHKAFGLCSTCYNSEYRRKQRAAEKLSTEELEKVDKE